MAVSKRVTRRARHGPIFQPFQSWNGLSVLNLSRTCQGLIDSGKYFEGAQTLTVKLLHPRMRSSRIIRI